MWLSWLFSVLLYSLEKNISRKWYKNNSHTYRSKYYTINNIITYPTDISCGSPNRRLLHSTNYKKILESRRISTFTVTSLIFSPECTVSRALAHPDVLLNNLITAAIFSGNRACTFPSHFTRSIFPSQLLFQDLSNTLYTQASAPVGRENRA